MERSMAEEHLLGSTSAPSHGPAEINRQPTFDEDKTLADENDPTDTDGLLYPLVIKERKVCGMCHRTTTDWTPNRGDYVRCNSCNTLRGRMNRVFKRNETLRDQWIDLAQEARDEWVKHDGATLHPAFYLLIW